MSAIFLKILNLAISASWLIVAVIVVRILLKKVPKWIFCLLWGLVAIKLICPFSLESALSLIPSSEVVPADIVIDQKPQIDSGMRVIDNAVNPVIESNFAPNVENSVNPMQVVVYVASIVWIMGFAGLCIYAFLSYVLLWKKVRTTVAIRGNVRECDEVQSPFILGIFCPLIYVPSGMKSETLDLVIAHEEAHMKRKDHWWKPLGFALLSVYWFNPLCWVAYILLCRDIEAACDEKVIRDKDREYIAAYSQALLDCSIQRRMIAACPLAFGEIGVKERVRSVLSYRKPAFWMILIAMIICIVVAICFMTNPKDDPNTEDKEAEHMSKERYSELHLESQVFDERFHIDSEMEMEENEYIGTVVYPGAESLVDQGIKVSVAETAADASSLFLALRVEGDRLLERDNLRISEGKMLLNGKEVSAFFGEMKKMDEGYYELEVCYFGDKYTFNESLLHKEAEILINSFSSIDPIDGKIEIVAKGEWNIKWNIEENGVSCGATGERLDAGDHHQYFDNGILLKGITTYTTRIEVEYIYPQNGLTEDRKYSFGMAYALDEDVYPPIPVGFLMRDGSIKRFDISAPGWSGYCDDKDRTYPLSCDEVFIYSHFTGIIVDPLSVKGVLFLDKDSKYIGTDDEYGVPELPLNEYQIFRLRDDMTDERYENERINNYGSR